MMTMSAIITFVLLVSKVAGMPPDPEGYMGAFGYMPQKMDNPTGGKLTSEAMTEAVKMFQRRIGLNITGVMDNSTAEMMKMPRCGMPDTGSMIVNPGGSGGLNQYVASGPRWTKADLTYHISFFGTQAQNGLTDAIIADAIAAAFKMWSDVTPLTFRSVATIREADIEVFFRPGQHGDGAAGAFDGAGGVLAHAYSPRNGDAHFDDGETYYVPGTGTGGSGNFRFDLITVAAHEFGHSLGLAHSLNNAALMAPFYKEIPALHQDDINGIQFLYGIGTPEAPVTDSPIPTTKPPVTDLFPGTVTEPTEPFPVTGCDNVDIDAVTTTEDGITYFFQGAYYWESEYDSSSQLIVTTSPKSITADWGLPANLDAAVTLDGATAFFKGDSFWVYQNKELLQGKTAIAQTFAGVPSDLDAAFLWGANDQFYVVKGDSYYRVIFVGPGEAEVARGYPRPLLEWGIESVGDVSQWINGMLYFYKGGNYSRFNDDTLQFDENYPASTSRVWLGCISDLIDTSQIVLKTDLNNNTPSDNNNRDLATQSVDLPVGGGASPHLPSSLIIVSFILCLFNFISVF